MAAATKRLAMPDVGFFYTDGTVVVEVLAQARGGWVVQDILVSLDETLEALADPERTSVMATDVLVGDPWRRIEFEPLAVPEHWRAEVLDGR